MRLSKKRRHFANRHTRSRHFQKRHLLSKNPPIKPRRNYRGSNNWSRFKKNNSNMIRSNSLINR